MIKKFWKTGTDNNKTFKSVEQKALVLIGCDFELLFMLNFHAQSIIKGAFHDAYCNNCITACGVNKKQKWSSVMVIYTNREYKNMGDILVCLKVDDALSTVSLYKYQVKIAQQVRRLMDLAYAVLPILIHR